MALREHPGQAMQRRFDDCFCQQGPADGYETESHIALLEDSLTDDAVACHVVAIKRVDANGALQRL